MQQRVGLERRQLLAGTAASLLPFGGAIAQGSAAGAANISVIGEPGAIDPMLTLADLVNQIDQHFFETLYYTDPLFHIGPVLAAAMPDISSDGRRYTIPLRENVPFHDGTVMTADDVVACLQRWLKLSARAKAATPYVTNVTAPDAKTVQIDLKQPYSPLMTLLSIFNGAAAIMPKRLASSTDPLKDFVGTGPYRLIEHVPDRYIRVGRFDKYASPPGKPNGFLGERHALIDEIRFVPAPNPTTRADGLISGQFHFADALTTESWMKLGGRPEVAQGKMIVPGWAVIVMNTKGVLTSDVRIRRAALAAISPPDMLAAAFGPPSVWTLEGALYPKGTELYDPNTPGYNEHDPVKARKLAKEAGYDGRSFRIFTTQQYDYMYKIAQVFEANLTEAGFKVDLQVMDWATLLTRRNDASIWEAFVTSSPVFPDPTLFSPFNRNYAGWWQTPTITAAVEAFTSAPDNEARLAAWKKMQALFYDEVPSLVVGYYALLYGISDKLQNFTSAQPPAFWNVSLKA
jgi:peptide/nickel transport system substrate-binding protein